MHDLDGIRGQRELVFWPRSMGFLNGEMRIARRDVLRIVTEVLGEFEPTSDELRVEVKDVLRYQALEE
jgi:hypothetical protein